MRQKALLLAVVFSLYGGTTLWARIPRKPVLEMEATAFSNWRRPTTAGTAPHEGVAASDPSILPLGSVIRVSGAGHYSGVYIVTDTGEKIAGRHIDLFIPSRARAREFGKKMVRVEVLDIGTGKRDAREKDILGRNEAGATVNKAPGSASADRQSGK
jgi:3D (Asp-Asp-Asp) domain-containing protein